MLLLGGAKQAFAQEDESWYKNALKHNASMNKQNLIHPQRHTNTVQQTHSNGTGARNVVNACDVMVNGGFETQLATPSHVNNMGGDFGGTNKPDQLSSWYAPTAGSSEYFATNATATSQVQPSNENSPFGSFTPYLATSNNDGLEGAIGLYARQEYFDSGPGSYQPRASEYAQLDMSRPLAAGGYYADFQVSISHNTATSLATNYGVNNGFGLVFTNTPNLVTRGGTTAPTNVDRDYLLIPNGAKTVFNQTPIDQNAINYGITGPSNWKHVSGQFISDGSLRYVTVGLFNSDPNNRIPLPNHRTDLINTYFLVDAIRLFKIPTAGSSTLVCNSSTDVVIGEGCPIPGATYTWSSPGIAGLPVNSTDIQFTVNPNSTTTYTLMVNLPDGTTFSSSTTISVEDRQMYAIDREDGTVCDNNTLYYIPLFTPGAMDPRYAATNGLTYSIYGPAQVSGSQFGYSPISGRFCVSIVPNRSLVQPSYELTITAHYANGCEASYTDYLGWDNSACWPWYYRITPNPASSELTITSQSPVESDATMRGKVDNTSSTGTEAWLYNGQGVLVKHGKSQTTSLILDVHDLPEGIYHLRSGTEKKSISKSIEIRH